MKLAPNIHSVGLALAGFRTLVAMGFKLDNVLNAKNPSMTPHDHVLDRIFTIYCKKDCRMRGGGFA